MSDGPTRLIVEGQVSRDGETIYVGGMLLSAIVLAAFPSMDWGDGKPPDLGSLRITIEKQAKGD